MNVHLSRHARLSASSTLIYQAGADLAVAMAFACASSWPVTSARWEREAISKLKTALETLNANHEQDGNGSGAVGRGANAGQGGNESIVLEESFRPVRETEGTAFGSSFMGQL